MVNKVKLYCEIAEEFQDKFPEAPFTDCTLLALLSTYFLKFSF